MAPNPFEELANQGADAATTFERCGFVWIKKSEAVELQAKLALAVAEATRLHSVDQGDEHTCFYGEVFRNYCLEDIAWRAKALLEGRME